MSRLVEAVKKGPKRNNERSPARRAYRFAKNTTLDLLAHQRVPRMPRHGLVPLEEATDVMLVRSRSPWYFSAQTYAQETAFAHAMADRGRPLAITSEADQIFEKNLVWFMPERLMAPRLWDYARQVQDFVSGLERQGNRVFCSSNETAYWENKVHMHRRLEEEEVPFPRTVFLDALGWEEASFDIQPVLIKEEHSAGSAGVHYFETARAARTFVAAHRFRPGETLLMQELVRGATRDLRITMVGKRAMPSCSYWRVKSAEALAAASWTTTATTYDSHVEHRDIPESAERFCAEFLQRLEVRTAGVDLMWTDDDLSSPPQVLEFSPYYQPNPPKPQRYAALSYREWKKGKRFAEEGYLEEQVEAFREIANSILDQGLY